MTKFSEKVSLILTLFSVLILGVLLGIQLQKEVPILGKHKKTQLSAIFPSRLVEVINYVEARYLEEIQQEELIKRTIDYLKPDTNASYIPSNRLKKIKEQVDFKPYGNK